MIQVGLLWQFIEEIPYSEYPQRFKGRLVG